MKDTVAPPSPQRGKSVRSCNNDDLFLTVLQLLRKNELTKEHFQNSIVVFSALFSQKAPTKDFKKNFIEIKIFQWSVYLHKKCMYFVFVVVFVLFSARFSHKIYKNFNEIFAIFQISTET